MDHAPSVGTHGGGDLARAARAAPPPAPGDGGTRAGTGRHRPGGVGLGPLASTDPTGPGGMGAPPPCAQATGRRRTAEASRARPPAGAGPGRAGRARPPGRATVAAVRDVPPHASPRPGPASARTPGPRARGARPAARGRVEPVGTRPDGGRPHPAGPRSPMAVAPPPDPHLPGAGAARRVGGRPPAGTGRGGQPRWAGTGHACPDPPRGHALPAGVEDGGGHAGGVPGGTRPRPGACRARQRGPRVAGGGEACRPPAARLRLGADRGGRHGDRTRLGPVERPDVTGPLGGRAPSVSCRRAPAHGPRWHRAYWSPIRLTWRGRPLVRPEGLVARIGADPHARRIPGAGGMSSRHLSPHEHGGRP